MSRTAHLLALATVLIGCNTDLTPPVPPYLANQQACLTGDAAALVDAIWNTTWVIDKGVDAAGTEHDVDDLCLNEAYDIGVPRSYFVFAFNDAPSLFRIPACVARDGIYTLYGARQSDPQAPRITTPCGWSLSSLCYAYNVQVSAIADADGYLTLTGSSGPGSEAPFDYRVRLDSDGLLRVASNDRSYGIVEWIYTTDNVGQTCDLGVKSGAF